MTPASPERLRERRKMIQDQQEKARLLELQEREDQIFLESLINRSMPGAIVWQKPPEKTFWPF